MKYKITVFVGSDKHELIAKAESPAEAMAYNLWVKPSAFEIEILIEDVME